MNLALEATDRQDLDRLAIAAYRKASGSRRTAWVWSWRTEAWAADGSYCVLQGTLLGAKPRYHGSNSYPVLATISAVVTRTATE